MHTLKIFGWIAAAGLMLAIVAPFTGTPHMLVKTQCIMGSSANCLSYGSCEYIGLEGWKRGPGPTCPFIRLLPLLWRPFA